MGIKNLFPYLQEAAKSAIKETQLKSYAGRTLAIDASAWMYQFLTIVRTGVAAENLQNEEGQATSHLQGFLMRSIKMLEVGAQPVFVFDGKAPEMKKAVNKARREARTEAAAEHDAAVASETATAEEVYKAASRSTLVTREHNSSVKELLRLMGLPVVEAPGEAEAACAQLCRACHVYASVTEDMDVLTFGTPRQVKNLFDVEGSRLGKGPRPAREIDLDAVLQELGCTMDRFIEFCILAGCDYLPHLPKVGAKTSFQLLNREGSLEGVISALRAGRGPKGCTVPDDWDWQAAKVLFMQGPTELLDIESISLERTDPDYDAVRTFLVDRNQFNVSRVENALTRLRKALGVGGAMQQKRLDAFFKPRTPMQIAPHLSAATTPKRNASQAVGLDSGRSHSDAKKHRISTSSECLRPASPSAHDAPATWSCSACTFLNAAELPMCEMCESPRTGASHAGVKGTELGASQFKTLRSSSVPPMHVIDLDE